MTLEPKRLNQHSWATFVRPSVKLKAFPSTKSIIETIMPFFPRDSTCIAGYLDDSDQFWKIAYHWELLVRMLNKATSLELQPRSKGQIGIILTRLLEDPPNPSKGYLDSKVVGEPHDKTPAVGIIRRWESMRICKQEFRLLLDFEQIPKKHPPSTPWDLSVAPVARPGTSKHGTGYALDIEAKGKNDMIRQIAKSLSATLRFDEKSHVHVEWKQGVLLGGMHGADDKHDGKWSGWKHIGGEGHLLTPG